MGLDRSSASARVPLKTPWMEARLSPALCRHFHVTALSLLHKTAMLSCLCSS